MSHLVLNSINTDIPGAWRIDRSLGRLLAAPPKRDRNEPMAYVDGTVPDDQFFDPGVYDLTMNVRGERDATGAAHGSFSAGLIENLLYLRTNIFMVKTLMPAVLHLDGNGTLVGDVQTANEVIADLGGYAVITFDLIVPDGALIPPP